MNNKKLKLLTARHYVKVALPFAVLLCVFFLQSMIDSFVTSRAVMQSSHLLKMFNVSIAEEDSGFIKDLMFGPPPAKPETFELSGYYQNPFIKNFYNVFQPDAVPSVTAAEEGASPDPEIVAPPRAIVSAVMNGKFKKCAVVNGRLVNLGDIVSENIRLTAVEDSRILLEGTWGKRWYYVQY